MNSCLIGWDQGLKVGQGGTYTPFFLLNKHFGTTAAFDVCFGSLRPSLEYVLGRPTVACLQAIFSIPEIRLLFDGILSGAANHPKSLLWLTPCLVPSLLCGPSLSHPFLSERFIKRTDWLPTCLYQFLHQLFRLSMWTGI